MQRIATPKPDPFLNMGLNTSKQTNALDKKYKDQVSKRIDNWDLIFSELMCRFARCQSIYYGSSAIIKSLNTKVEMYNPILKEIVDELLSYLKSNPRSITIDIPRYTNVLKDILNDIIGSVMIKGDVYNRIIRGFKDYLIYGISILKMNTCSKNVINIENVDVSTCVWDTECDYKNFNPSFFIREYITSNFDASNKYGEKFTNTKNDKSIIFERLNKSSKTILENVRSTIESSNNENDKIVIEYNDDIFRKNGKIVTKSRIGDGVSQIIEYYRLVNIKDKNNGEVHQNYEKCIFVNGMLAESEGQIKLDEFPYITMANFRHDASFVSEMFDSKVADAMSEVIQLNIIENSHCDAVLSSSNGAMLLDKNALVNKTATLKNIKANVILLDPTNGQSAGNAVVNLPPARIDQSTMVQSQEIKNSLRRKFGLLTFDPNQAVAKSGYHEALRLDRESQSINNIITPLDACLNIIGKRLVEFIKEYSKKGIDTLIGLTKIEDAEENLKAFADIDEYINVDVSESRESANNSMKIYNQLQSLSDLMGVPLQLPPDVLAEALNLSQEVIDMFKQNNAPQGNELESAEIEEKKASTADKLASAKKKNAEAQALA